MEKTLLQRIWPGLVLVVLVVVVATYYFVSEKNETKNPAPPKTLTLHISLHKDDTLTCDLTETVERTVPYTLQTADAALRELFMGPTEEEKTRGLSSTFEPSPALATIFTEGEVKPLVAYYRGVSIKEKIAIVDFAREALAYLNSPACLQISVKSPIIRTLLQFPSIEQVEFSIDGELYTEWDA